ncbi:MAG: 4-alpha-glucanotransferase, partial [Thiobacillus sp.]
LQAAGVGVWQMLPLGRPLAGRSPYQCASAFAVDPALFPDLISVAVDTLQLRAWRAAQQHWIEDYALFMAIKAEQHGAAWTDWPAELRRHDPEPLHRFAAEHAAAIEALVVEQYQAYSYWQSLHAGAAARGIRLFGDMPIFVAHDSADVWAHPEYFLLDDDGHPSVVAGVPPDYFSATGQRWGNPHYNWEAMNDGGFDWWRARLRNHFEWFDLVRIDHFRGLVAVWVIPASDDTAVNGHWQPVPGAALLQALLDEMGSIPLVAEDLGVITPEVTALRRQFELPGMAVLQFAFDAHADNPHKPENVEADTVYYTGTHDNDTTVGWFAALPAEVRQQVMQQLGVDDPARVAETMQDIVLYSRAALAVLPLQDVLEFGSEARMNTPGTAYGNWSWRFQWDDLPADLAPRLRQKLYKAHRCETP